MATTFLCNLGLLSLQDGTWNDETCENPQSGFVCKAPKALVHTGTPQINLAAGCSNVSVQYLSNNIYIFIAIALDESIILDVLHFPMKNIKSRDLEATPMGEATSKPIQ